MLPLYYKKTSKAKLPCFFAFLPCRTCADAIFARPFEAVAPIGSPTRHQGGHGVLAWGQLGKAPYAVCVRNPSELRGASTRLNAGEVGLMAFLVLGTKRN